MGQRQPMNADATRGITRLDLVQWSTQLDRGYGRLYPAEATAILEGIARGVDIEYEGDRLVARFHPNHNSCFEVGVEVQIDTIVAADVASGAKAGPFPLDSPPFPTMTICPLGAVPKASGGIRLIVDMSFPKIVGGDSINSQIVVATFTLESFDHATDLVRRFGRGCFLIKFDVEAAYKQIPVREEDRALLGFIWRGQIYYDRTLPFGLRSSCRLWDMYASALHYFFRTELDVHCVHYIDDFLFVIPESKGIEFATRARDAALAMCQRLGLPMAAKKTEGPTTRLVFLGIQIDTEAMTASLPEHKLALLTSTLVGWDRPDRRATVKEMQSLAGQLAFAAKVVRAGRPFMRRIIGEQHRLRHAAFHARAHGSTAFFISEGARADVRWWAANIRHANGEPIMYDELWTVAADMTLFTDASKVGYGCSFQNEWIAGLWTADHMQQAEGVVRYSMPYLELYALVLAASAWGRLWRGRKITFRCDCMPVVQAIAKMSSAKPKMQTLVRLLASNAAEHGFDFRVIHVAGVDNDRADALSRANMRLFFQLCPSASPVGLAVSPLVLDPHA